MRIGVTGSRTGPTEAQRAALFRLLEEFTDLAESLHDGGCTGVDEAANKMATELGIYRVGHPPTLSIHRGHCIWDEEREPKDYITRDHELADEIDMLIAVPATPYEVVRSGTWATVRYARDEAPHHRHYSA